MDTYTSDGHYSQQRPPQPQWPPHLLAPSHPQASFPSPPASDHGQQQHYYFQTPQQSDPRPPSDPLHRATSSLSLNLSSLTVASPTNLSPINPPSAAAALSPVTPISPSTNPFGHHLQHSAHGMHTPHGHASASHGGHNHGHAPPSHHMQQSPFAYDPSQGTPGQQSPSHYDDQHHQQQQQQQQGGGVPPGSSAGYDTCRTPGPSRSSSSGTPATSQLPRKRSFTANSNAPSAAPAGNASAASGGPGGSSTSGNGSGGLGLNVSSTLVEEGMYDDESRDAAMELASSGPYEDMDVRAAAYGAAGSANAAGSGPGGGSGSGGSPVDGSGSTSGAEDSFGMLGGGGGGPGGGVGGTMNVLGKPIATNNFVTKLYQ
ncbi:hypothetical protein CPB84DRAFT_1495734 [Gymnopilus junonius]|uniref:Uncharacterized protein n=1 Tax=Gymnopilus junonius TaxID=109634 RepID=A0A9P5NYU5_GYMJU|nr:hypothetical protein CPB84DRAFT_1495734 [Gymnopilus junonius]